LQALKPHSGFDLMPTEGVEDMVVEGEEVARDAVVGADICPGSRDLR
jgi:hypothetical protein